MIGDEITVEHAWAHLHEAFRAEAAKTVNCKGTDWYQITPEEQKVFGIALASMPMLVAAYRFYEEILDLTDTGLLPPAIMAMIRKDLAEHIGMESGIISQTEFQRFAKLLGISNRTAHAWYAKHEFWCVRRGIQRYEDDGEGLSCLA